MSKSHADSRQKHRLSRRWVVKIGTSLLTSVDQGLDQQAIDNWVGQIAELKKSGIEFVLVSSGSIGEGVRRLGWRHRPREVHQLQAAAAVGQMGLVQAYESSFKHFGIVTAQVLLTHADLANRERYLNARSTLRTLIKMGVVPITNENDTVVNDEIRFGDNDTLAALVANLIDADQLVLLTDQQGLFSADPRLHENSTLIANANVTDPRLLEVAGGSIGDLGRGGMQTKIKAAKLAARSGTSTYIASGRMPAVLTDFAAGQPSGTVIAADVPRVLARKRWLAGQLKPGGRLVLDNGAVVSLCKHGRSLLPVGVAASQGNYKRGDLVVCVDQAGIEVARGLVNFSATEVMLLKGRSSSDQQQLLGYRGDDELIHRDNLVLTG